MRPSFVRSSGSWFFTVALVLAGCGAQVLRPAVDAGGNRDASPPSDVPSFSDVPPPLDVPVLVDGARACADNGACDRSQFCASATCGGSGFCVTRPTTCPELYSPTCGCDGRTYDNPCFAAAAGSRVAYAGACAFGPDAAATDVVRVDAAACTSNANCSAAQWCDAPTCAGPGVCTIRPDVCPRIYAPVCGCDGVTYANDCIAHQSRARVRASGACSPEAGVETGVDATAPEASVDSGPTQCTTNAQCATRYFCAGTTCSGAGVCTYRPAGCPLLYAPVCGCDGRTYGNSCEAAAAGSRVATDGPCPDAATGSDAASDAAPNLCLTVRCSAGYTCCPFTGNCYPSACLGCCVATPGDAGPAPCTDNIQCGDGRYCAGMGCGTAGTCEARPDLCNRILAPVCGCDGATYSNECLAAVAGVRVSYTGTCVGPEAGVDRCAAVTCAAGMTCCSLTGLCVNPACLSCCMFGNPDGGNGACTTNEQCGNGRYCAGNGCGTTGWCDALPTICPAIDAPACGCDTRTYSNRCYAAAAGVRVAYDGICR